jgi:uncharacterized protein (DUF1778 family)
MDKLFSLELTRSEKDLLLNDLDVPPEIDAKLRLPAQRGNSITVKLALEQLDRLIGALEEAANGAEERELAKAYRDLIAKLERSRSAA